MPEKNNDCGRKLAANASHGGGDPHDQLATTALGGVGPAVHAQLVEQIATAGAGHRSGDAYWDTAAASAEALIAMDPQTPGQAMLASLAITVKDAAMERIANSNTAGLHHEVRAQELSQGLKAASTAATLIEAFEKSRAGGNPGMTVGQVNIHAGGQAIVGQVQASAGTALPPVDERGETPGAMKPARRVRRKRPNE